MRLLFHYIIRKKLLNHTAGRILPKKNNQSGSDLYPYGILFSHGFAAGVAVSFVTTRTWWYSGIRQLLIGSGAAALTWFLGTTIGAAL